MADRYFEVNKINVRYGDIQVLWDIEFTADKGEIVALAVFFTNLTLPTNREV